MLTRDQIEKEILGNNDEIYQIQEDQIEPIQKVITSLNDQINSINRLKEQWQDYYKTLEENAVDPLTGFKYKDLNKLKAFYDAAQDMGMDAAEALQYAITQTGIQITPDAFYKAFNITPPKPEDVGAGSTTGQNEWEIFNPAYQAASASDKQFINKLFGNKAPTKATFDALAADRRNALVNALAQGLTDAEKAQLNAAFGLTEGGVTPPTGGATTQDINAGKEAAIQALPEVVKVRDAAQAIKKAIVETPAKIVEFTQSMVNNAQPAIDNAKTSAQGVLTKFKNLGKYLVEELMPNSLTPFKDFVAEDLLIAVNNIITAFMNVNGQITGAITNVANLTTSLNSMPKDIQININIHTTYTSSGGGSNDKNPPKNPKKFAGGLIKMATGGMIPGGVPRDSVPILASPGEFVVRNAMVDKYGMSMLNDINQGSFQPTFRTPSGTSYTKINKPTEINTNRTMYNNNYSINVTANTNANADEIASATVMKIRQMNSMQIRGARG